MRKKELKIMNQKMYDESAGKIVDFFLIINIINIALKQTIQTGFIINYLTPILGVIYLFKLFKERRYVKFVYSKIIILEILFIFLISISIFRHSLPFTTVIKRYIWILAFCIPLGVIASKVKDSAVFLEQTKISNFIVFIVSLILFVRTYIKDGGFTYDNYNMSICYTLLFPMFYHVIKIKEKKWYVFIVALELIIVVFYGSRGQLLCIGVFFLLLMIQKVKIKDRLLLFIIFGMTGIMLFLFKDFIIYIISPIAGRFGSRTLNMLIQGRLLTDTGRMTIWIKTMAYIKQNPLIGWGVGGELSYLSSYPHNLYLELFLHYGMLVGTLISVWLTYIIMVRVFFEKEYNSLIIILFSCAFVPLLLSGTYTEAPLFWMLIGICLKQSFVIGRKY